MQNSELEKKSNRLLSCPFCGGEAFVDTHKFWDVEAKDFTVQTYGVRCYECQAGTMQYFRTEEDAIKQWNTRKPMERIVEQLEEQRRYAFNVVYKEAMKKAIEVVRNGGKE